VNDGLKKLITNWTKETRFRRGDEREYGHCGKKKCQLKRQRLLKGFNPTRDQKKLGSLSSGTHFVGGFGGWTKIFDKTGKTRQKARVRVKQGGVLLGGKGICEREQHDVIQADDCGWTDSQSQGNCTGFMSTMGKTYCEK